MCLEPLVHACVLMQSTHPCNAGAEWLEYSKDKQLEGCKRTLKTGAAAAAGKGPTSVCCHKCLFWPCLAFTAVCCPAFSYAEHLSE